MHAIYARVSTEDQARHGYSLESQLKACRDRLRSMGVADTREYVDDGYSGEFIERPALDRLREDLRAGLVKSVTIYDPDRMSRNLTVQLVLADEIEKAGAKLFFVTGDYDASPEGRLFFSMKGAVSAYEKAKIRERTMRGKRQKAALGKIVFNANPFGYGWDAEKSLYVIDDAEAKVVRMIYDLFLGKNLGTRLIAMELKQRGIIGPKGKPLSPVTVHKVLSREMYCGTHYLFRQRVQKTGQKERNITNVSPEDWVPVKIPAIVSREKWEKAQIHLKRNRKMARRNCQREYLLRGVLHCSLCGRAMIATTRPQPRKTTGPKVYAYYTCITKESGTYALAGKRCPCMRIPVQALDERVWGIFRSIAEGEANFSRSLRENNTADVSAEIGQISAYRDELIKRQGQIARLIREGLLDADSAEGELREAKRDIVAVNAKILSLRTSLEKATVRMLEVNMAEILTAVTFEQRREIILRSGYCIYAARPNRDQIDFYFE